MRDMRDKCKDFKRCVYRLFDECTNIGWTCNGASSGRDTMTPAMFEARINGQASLYFSEYHPDVANAVVMMLLEVLVVDGVPFRELNEKLQQMVPS